MDVVVWLGGKLMRCLREDVAIDSLVEAWVTIYWGLCGAYAGTPTLIHAGVDEARG